MKKLLIYVMILAMIALPLLTACGESSDSKSDTSSTGGTTNNGTNNGDPEDPLATFPLEERNYEGAVITVLTRSAQHWQQFVYIEESTSETINEAVKARNEFIEEKYGITIEVVNSGAPLDDLTMDIESDLQTYQLVSENVYNMTQKFTDGLFYSLNDLLDLNQPWWDQNAINQLTLSDKIFFVADFVCI